jgi:integrase
VKVQGLRPDQVRALLAHNSAAGLIPRSVQIFHGTLRAMLGEAVREEVITRNPAVGAPSLEHHEVKPWSPEEASHFLTASAGHRLYALFAVGVALGLRRGELLALRWPMWTWTSGWPMSARTSSDCPRSGSSTAAPRPDGRDGRSRCRAGRSRCCGLTVPVRPAEVRVVRDVLGHSQIAITMDLYSHVMPSALREAADAIDRAFGQGE